MISVIILSILLFQHPSIPVEPPRPFLAYIDSVIREFRHTETLPAIPVKNKKSKLMKKEVTKEYTVLPIEEQQKLKQYILEKFGKYGREALAVANSENGYYSPDRMSATSDLGIFQINQIHWNRFGKDNLKDPYKNIDAAHQICLDAEAKGRDCLSPWTDYRNGNYKKYLDTGTGSVTE